MKVYANVMVQNEAIILPHVFEYWNEYPVDKWVFYDDNSTDDTIQVIKDNFGDKAKVFSSKDPKFNESKNRSTMLEFSRESGADLALAIDADELLSANMINAWSAVTRSCMEYDIHLYWYNVVGSIAKIRQDPLYLNNYRNFFISLKACDKFNMGLYKYHTPRLPNVNLDKLYTQDIGVIHLQSINKRYYALKQLWYKHYEKITWGHSIQEINGKYDPVINNLNFQEANTPDNIMGQIDFDASVYDEIEKSKGYKQFILDNYDEQLITFGKEFL